MPTGALRHPRGEEGANLKLKQAVANVLAPKSLQIKT